MRELDRISMTGMKSGRIWCLFICHNTVLLLGPVKCWLIGNPSKMLVRRLVIEDYRAASMNPSADVRAQLLFIYHSRDCPHCKNFPTNDNSSLTQYVFLIYSVIQVLLLMSKKLSYELYSKWIVYRVFKILFLSQTMRPMANLSMYSATMAVTLACFSDSFAIIPLGISRWRIMGEDKNKLFCCLLPSRNWLQKS